MPAMLLSKEEWKEVRKASEAGVDDSQLSKEYGVSQGAIRVRKMREKWLTPRRLAEEAAVAKVRKEMKNHTNAVVTAVTKPVSDSVIVEDFARDGASASRHAMKILLGKLAKAVEDPDSIADLEDVGDVVTAVKGARLIAGLDKEGSNVTLNLGAFWEAPVEGSGPEAEKPLVVREVD